MSKLTWIEEHWDRADAKAAKEWMRQSVSIFTNYPNDISQLVIDV
jgi:hypothetical protein